MGVEVGDVYAKVSIKDDIDSGLSSIHSKFNSFGSQLESKAASIGNAVGGALKTGIIAGTAALAGIATVGVTSFMDLESSAADAASKTGAMGDEFVKVKQKVIDLSRDLGKLNTNSFDPNQIGKAMANLAAGGFDVANASAKDLAPILALATAANYDLDKSAEMATGTMNMFGKGVGDLGHISDMYVTAAGKSSAGMEDMNYAMQYAGPVAAGMGISMEKVTANIEAFSTITIKGEKAGTALRDGLNTLIAPSKASAEALDAMGISVASVDPRTHDFNQTLAMMKAKADASGEGMAAFNKVFGVTGGMLYQLAGMTPKVAEFQGQLENSAGAAERMARLMNDTLGASFNAAKGAAMDLAIGIGERLAPSLKAVFDWFGETGAPAIQSFIDAVANGDWSKVGQMVKQGIGFAFSEIGDLGGQIWAKVEPSINEIKPKVIQALQGLGEGAGVAIAGAGLLALAPTIATAGAGILTSLGDLGGSAVAKTGEMAAGVVEKYGLMAGTATGRTVKMAAEVGGAFLEQKAVAIGHLASMVPEVGNKYRLMAEGGAYRLGVMASTSAQKWGGMAAYTVQRAAIMSSDTIGHFSSMASGIGTKLGGMATTATSAVGTLVGGLASIAAPAALVVVGLGAIGYALNPSKFTEFNKVGTDTFNALSDTASDCWEDIEKGDFSGAANRLKEAFQGAIDYAKGLDWGKLGSEVVTMVGDGAKAIVKTAMDIGSWIHDTAKAWVASDGPKNLGRSIGDAIINAIKGFFKDDGTSLWDKLKAAWGVITDWGKLGLDIIMGIAGGIKDSIKSALAPAENDFITWLEALDKGAANLGIGIQNIFRSAVNAGQEVLKGFVDVWNSTIDSLTGGSSESNPKQAGTATPAVAETKKTLPVAHLQSDGQINLRGGGFSATGSVDDVIAALKKAKYTSEEIRQIGSNLLNNADKTTYDRLQKLGASKLLTATLGNGSFITADSLNGYGGNIRTAAEDKIDYAEYAPLHKKYSANLPADQIELLGREVVAEMDKQIPKGSAIGDNTNAPGYGAAKATQQKVDATLDSTGIEDISNAVNDKLVNGLKAAKIEYKPTPLAMLDPADKGLMHDTLEGLRWGVEKAGDDAEKMYEAAIKDVITAQDLAKVPPALIGAFTPITDWTKNLPSTFYKWGDTVNASGKQLSSNVASASQQFSGTIVRGTQNAANSLSIGAQVAATGFSTTVDAVTIRYDQATGRQVAMIGSVGESVKTKGTELMAVIDTTGVNYKVYSADAGKSITDAGTGFGTDVGDAGDGIISDGGTVGDNLITDGNTFGTNLKADGVTTGKSITDAGNALKTIMDAAGATWSSILAKTNAGSYYTWDPEKTTSKTPAQTENKFAPNEFYTWKPNTVNLNTNNVNAQTNAVNAQASTATLTGTRSAVGGVKQGGFQDEWMNTPTDKDRKFWNYQKQYELDAIAGQKNNWLGDSNADTVGVMTPAEQQQWFRDNPGKFIGQQTGAEVPNLLTNGNLATSAQQATGGLTGLSDKLDYANGVIIKYGTGLDECVKSDEDLVGRADKLGMMFYPTVFNTISKHNEAYQAAIAPLKAGVKISDDLNIANKSCITSTNGLPETFERMGFYGKTYVGTVQNAANMESKLTSWSGLHGEAVQLSTEKYTAHSTAVATVTPEVTALGTGMQAHNAVLTDTTSYTSAFGTAIKSGAGSAETFAKVMTMAGASAYLMGASLQKLASSSQSGGGLDLGKFVEDIYDQEGGDEMMVGGKYKPTPGQDDFSYQVEQFTAGVDKLCSASSPFAIFQELVWKPFYPTTFRTIEPSESGPDVVKLGNQKKDADYFDKKVTGSADDSARTGINASKSSAQTSIAAGQKIDQAHIVSGALADQAHAFVMQQSGANWYATGWQVGELTKTSAAQASATQQAGAVANVYTWQQGATADTATRSAEATQDAATMKDGADYGKTQGVTTADYHATTVKGGADGFKTTIEAASAGWVTSWETIQAGMQTVVQGVGAIVGSVGAFGGEPGPGSMFFPDAAKNVGTRTTAGYNAFGGGSNNWGGAAAVSGNSGSVTNVGGVAVIGGHRAEGGPVKAGMAYLVGERGPEPFIPTTDGVILPNRYLARPVSPRSGQDSGSQNTTITIEIPLILEGQEIKRLAVKLTPEIMKESKKRLQLKGVNI